jgi:SAM-dependent methyltransferase
VPDAAAFRDLFSAQAATYAAFRPSYPPALFAWLADVAPARTLAWDCATGSGQAALGLSPHFARVIATDASAAQLAHATPAPNVEYRVARAEASELPDGAADLVNVAQAVHWFDLDRFYAEARRVLAPGGVLALSSYGSARLDEPALAAAFSRFEHETLGDYWPDGRQHVGEALRTIPFPFAELAPPPFALERRWTLAELLGYARSWSATAAFVARHGRDPVDALADALAPLWGEATAARTVRWPFVVRAGRVG